MIKNISLFIWPISVNFTKGEEKKRIVVTEINFQFF